MPEQPEQQSNKIDDYTLVSVIATGKSAQVWEAMHEQSGQMVALKLLLPEAMSNADDKALLKHEGKLGKDFEHPNLVRCLGVVMRKTECYILMDLFKTPNLKSFIFNDRATVHVLFRKMVEGVSLGLGHMHDKGWVHKDIKPDNILLNRSGEVRVIDFSLAVKKSSGLSKLMSSKRVPIRGTRTYLAPETIKKEGSTPATDIYSFGVVLYEALTGTTPFKGDTPQDLLKKHIAATPMEPSLLYDNVSPQMDRFVMKMLAKRPKDRFQSMADLLAEIRSIPIFKDEKRDDEDDSGNEEKEAVESESVSDSPASPEEQELEELMLMGRRDSRADARIRQLLEGNPALQKKAEEMKAVQEEIERKKQADLKRRLKSLEKESSGGEKKKKKKKKAPAPQPAAEPAYYPQHQMPPGYGQPAAQAPPGYAMPSQPVPYGMPQPGMPAPPPGYYPPQQYPPGMPPQGYPGQPMPPQGYPGQPMPPQGYPGQPMQGQPVPQQQPDLQQQQNPPAAAPPPATPQPPAEPPAPTGDLPLMTELPEVE